MLQTRDYTILKSIRAVCPRCFAENDAFDPEYPTDFCDGHLVERDGAVYLRRWCRRGHGEVWSLYEESAELWRGQQQWRVPTKQIHPDTETVYPLPTGYEHGLGPAHLQHSCIYLLDVTTQCNLQCPACFTSSSPALSHYLPLDQIVRAVEVAIEREGGRLDVVMISGGEPTVHPQLLPVLEALAAMPITRIIVNTNGIRLANEDALLAWLAERSDRFEIYLQYDGQSAETHLALRGDDLRSVKERAVRRLSDARLFTTLVMTVSKVNEAQVGEVLDTAFDMPYIGGVSFQPLFTSGRAPQVDSMDRITTTGVMNRIERQSGHGISARDLIALPCSHPDCCAIGYFIKTKDGRFRSLAALTGDDAMKKHLSLFGNSISFGDALSSIRTALTGVMSESMTLSRPELLEHLRVLCRECGFGGLTELAKSAFGARGGAHFVAERVKRVTIKHFMDADMLITERLDQCCVHVAGAGNDPVRMPFCAARLFPKVRERAAAAMVRRAEL